MALVESTEIDKIEVVGPHKAVQVRKALVVKKDGVEIARSLERYSLTPGQLKGTTNADGSPASDAQDFVDNDISAEPFRLLRIERNKLIAETDWTQLKDIDLDIIRERNWKNYRQALRDLPANSNPKLSEDGTLDKSSVTWPDKPSS